MQKKKKRRKSPQGDGESARKSLFEIILYYQWLQYQKNDIIPLVCYTERTQELTKCKKLKISGKGETLEGFQMAQK